MEEKINDLKPWIWSLSLNFGFSSRTSQSQQRTAKAITHFTIQIHAKNLDHFTKLNSLNIGKNILPQHSQEPYSLHRFSSKHVFDCSQKKIICTIPFLDVQKQHSWKTWKANVFIFLYITVRKLCSRDVGSFYLVVGLNNFLNAARCLDLEKYFKNLEKLGKVFHFNWNFLRFNYFSAFWYLHQEHLNAEISDNLWCFAWFGTICTPMEECYVW